MARLIGTPLDLVSLSNVALLIGIEMGFNFAGVESWVDSETFERRLAITWGNTEHLKEFRPSRAFDWAFSYDEDVLCIRAKRTFEFDDSTRLDSVDVLKARFTEHLLELADA